MKKPGSSSSSVYSWRFFRAGGFDQVRLDSGRDLLALEHLDQKLWVALACPVDNVQFDNRTLALIDSDGDRRVRVSELIAAIKWIGARLSDPEDLIAAKGEITLKSISTQTEEGRALAAAAKSALLALGRTPEDAISVEDTQSLEKALSDRALNGDGVITEDSSPDSEVSLAIRDIIAVLGPATDRCGKPGVNADKVNAFFDAAREFLAWTLQRQEVSDIAPLGDATEGAAKALADVCEKIEDFFARCAMVAFDSRMAGSLCGGEREFEALGTGPLSMESLELARLPIARVTPEGLLPFFDGVNPTWTEKMRALRERVVLPLLGEKTTLSRGEWNALQGAFGPWFAWQKRKPSVAMEGLSIERLRSLLGSDLKRKLLDIIDLDTAESATVGALIDLEKMVRFRRDLFRLCTNFVNFKDFYAQGGTAIFQAGTLYLDQRSCTLCIKVDDPTKHAAMAAMAGTYLAYCECRRRAGGEKMNIVAAFTNGDSENLIVGRNGVFYDRSGNDWDATIVKIIENPISLRQAFWLPYKNFVRMIESQVAKRAAAAETRSEANLRQTAEATAHVDKAMVPESPKKFDVGIVAALGVAAGALGTFIATLLGYVAGIVRLGPLAIVAAVAGLILLVSGPSLILAHIKLRKRNLGPILDAGGWAVNAKARINVPFGAVLTQIATLPAGSQRDLVDPYAERKSPWPRVVVAAIVLYLAYAVVNHFGFINEWSGGRIGLKREAIEKTPGKPASSVVPASHR